MTENAMTRAIAACVEAAVPVLLWGPPGQGKTARLTQLGNAWGRHVETIAASTREPSDLLGLPMEVNGRVVYSPLSWAMNLNAADKGLLFIDELTTARPSVFSGLLRVIQEKVVGEYELAPTVSIVAAANPPEVAVDGIDLPAPVANRFVQLDWVPDYALWSEHRSTGFAHVQTPDPRTYLAQPTAEHRVRVASQIDGFLNARPDFIDAMPDAVEDQGGAWPSMRSWTNVERALVHLRLDDEDARMLVLVGGVGKAAATEFFAWVSTADLPDPLAVLRTPSMVKWANERADRVFAILSAVGALVRMHGTKATWEGGVKVATYVADAGRPDAALALARTLIGSEHAQGGVPSAFRTAFIDLFSRAGLLTEAA